MWYYSDYRSKHQKQPVIFSKKRNSKLNDVEFYFLYSSPDVDNITVDGYDFIVPGVESKKKIIRKINVLNT